MDKGENLHAGHRARMVEKFLKNPELFSDHEILEILLFYALPRKDTNALAHKFLRTFGDLNGVLNASVEQIKSVDGSGDKDATFFMMFKKVIERLKNTKKEAVYMGTFEQTVKVVVPFFDKMRTETFAMFLLDKNFKLLATTSFCDNNRASVGADLPELISAFNTHKPACAIIAHNHPSNNPMPSKEDFLTTKKLFILCELNGVVLTDHIIVSGERTFSFRMEGVFEKVKETSQLNKIFDKLQGEII